MGVGWRAIEVVGTLLGVTVAALALSDRVRRPRKGAPAKPKPSPNGGLPSDDTIPLPAPPLSLSSLESSPALPALSREVSSTRLPFFERCGVTDDRLWMYSYDHVATNGDHDLVFFYLGYPSVHVQVFARRAGVTRSESYRLSTFAGQMDETGGIDRSFDGWSFAPSDSSVSVAPPPINTVAITSGWHVLVLSADPSGNLLRLTQMAATAADYVNVGGLSMRDRVARLLGTSPLGAAVAAPAPASP